MRIGHHLVPSGSVTIDDLLDQARAAAARRLDSVWTNQHPGGWDPLGVLGPLRNEGPAELGTAVVPTYPRHPVVMATEALTTQAATGGRLTLGIGPSHEIVMTGEFGLPYSAPAEHTREYLQVLRPLLRGEHVRHKGKFFTVDTELEVTAEPPPILVAALGPRMLSVTRDLADGTIALWARPRTIADYVIPRLGDGQRVALMLMVSITSDPDGVRDTIARDYALSGNLPAYRAMLDRGGLAGPADAAVAGGEAAVVAELYRYRDAGVTDLIVSPLGTPRERDRVLDVVAGLVSRPSGSAPPAAGPAIASVDQR